MWLGMVGGVVAQRGDMAVGPMIGTARRAQAVHFTQPYLTVGMVLMTRRQGVTFYSIPRSALFFLSPFTLAVWMCVVLAVIAVSALLALNTRVNPRELVLDAMGKASPLPTFELGDAVQTTVSTFLQQGYSRMPTRLKFIILEYK